MYSRTNTFGAELHKSNIRIKKYYNKYENGELDWKINFFFNDLLTKSNRTEIQTYKVEERTFRTPCSRPWLCETDQMEKFHIVLTLS